MSCLCQCIQRLHLPLSHGLLYICLAIKNKPAFNTSALSSRTTLTYKQEICLKPMVLGGVSIHLYIYICIIIHNRKVGTRVDERLPDLQACKGSERAADCWSGPKKRQPGRGLSTWVEQAKHFQAEYVGKRCFSCLHLNEGPPAETRKIICSKFLTQVLFEPVRSLLGWHVPRLNKCGG